MSDVGILISKIVSDLKELTFSMENQNKSRMQIAKKYETYLAWRCPSVSPSEHPSIRQVHIVCMDVCLFCHCGVANWFVGLKIDTNVCCGVKEDQRKIKEYSSS